MNAVPHTAIYIYQDSDSNKLIDALLSGKLGIDQLDFATLNPVVLSENSLKLFLEEEFLHGGKAIDSTLNRSLHQMSSGEQKKALLHHLLNQSSNCLILDELYDHIDWAGQAFIKELIIQAAETKTVIQLVRRIKDLLPVIENWLIYQPSQLFTFSNKQSWADCIHDELPSVPLPALPQPLKHFPKLDGPLVAMQNLSVSYEERPIVHAINWTIQAGEFWQLMGPNGSGKSTLLSLITGDNPKGYGQELYLFGRKKGSGETVWDIKKNIGYFNASITLHFSRMDSIEKMIVSGFNDSIGLYLVPTDQQIRLAGEWLRFLGLSNMKNKPIQMLSLAQQRMVLIARAMVKHPPLLILDEPTAGLDESGVAMIVQMIQQIASESNSAILYVSHSKEEGLKPSRILELHPSNQGSIARISSLH